MHFFHLMLSLLIATKPLWCADALQPTKPSETIVSVSRIAAPFEKLRTNQNGIVFPALEGHTYWNNCNKEYIVNDYTYTESSEVDIINQPRKTVWIYDPQKKEHMPTLLHHATNAFLYTAVVLNHPNDGGTIDYQVESHQPTDQTFMKVHCIVLFNGTVTYQGYIACKNQLNIEGPLENPLFKNLHIVTLTAQRLIGQGTLVKLCTQLPQLIELSIKNTPFEDTRLTLIHGTLQRCKIKNCGITKIGSVIAPRLVFLSLRSNELKRFDIHTLDLQPCTIDLRNNKIGRVCSDDEPNWPLPPSYLYLQGNPLDKRATYRGLFNKEMPENDTDRLDRSNNTLLLDLDDCAFHNNGVVEYYKKSSKEV